MRLIEFLGVPGSGKSTTLGLLESDAPAAGIRLQRLDPVGRIAIARQGRDPVTRAMARTVGRYWRSAWKRAMVRSSDRVSILSRAIVKRPELAAAMIEANDAHNHDAGADRVMGMLLNHLIGFQLAEETLGDREWLLLDEGLCNRVTSLFAAGFDADLTKPSSTATSISSPCRTSWWSSPRRSTCVSTGWRRSAGRSAWPGNPQ